MANDTFCLTYLSADHKFNKIPSFLKIAFQASSSRVSLHKSGRIQAFELAAHVTKFYFAMLQSQVCEQQGPENELQICRWAYCLLFTGNLLMKRCHFFDKHVCLPEATMHVHEAFSGCTKLFLTVLWGEHSVVSINVPIGLNLSEAS